MPPAPPLVKTGTFLTVAAFHPWASPMIRLHREEPPPQQPRKHGFAKSLDLLCSGESANSAPTRRLKMFSMVADLLLIVALLVLLLAISVGSYFFLTYCCPDVDHILQNEERQRRFLALTTALAFPGGNFPGMPPMPPMAPPPAQQPTTTTTQPAAAPPLPAPLPTTSLLPHLAQQQPAVAAPAPAPVIQRVRMATVSTNTPPIGHKCNGQATAFIDSNGGGGSEKFLPPPIPPPSSLHNAEWETDVGSLETETSLSGKQIPTLEPGKKWKSREDIGRSTFFPSNLRNCAHELSLF